MNIGQESTQEYFNNLNIKVGDRFAEMMSFFINVISTDGRIITIEGNPSGNMSIREYDTPETFKRRCQYSTDHSKYWIYFLGNDIQKVKNWIHHYKNNYYKIDSADAKRQLNIDKILYPI